MDDMISRQAAIKVILEQHTDAYYPSWYAKLIETLPAAQPEQRWIPVTERLPDKNGQYLTTEKFFGVFGRCVRTFRLDVYDPDNGLTDHHAGFTDCGEEMGVYEVKTVVAWMPLPEPYREDEQG